MAYRSDDLISLTVQKTCYFVILLSCRFCNPEKPRLSLYVTDEYILIFAYMYITKNSIIIAAIKPAANIYR